MQQKSYEDEEILHNMTMSVVSIVTIATLLETKTFCTLKANVRDLKIKASKRELKRVSYTLEHPKRLLHEERCQNRLSG